MGGEPKLAGRRAPRKACPHTRRELKVQSRHDGVSCQIFALRSTQSRVGRSQHARLHLSPRIQTEDSGNSCDCNAVNQLRSTCASMAVASLWSPGDVLQMLHADALRVLLSEQSNPCPDDEGDYAVKHDSPHPHPCAWPSC